MVKKGDLTMENYEVILMLSRVAIIVIALLISFAIAFVSCRRIGFYPSVLVFLLLFNFIGNGIAYLAMEIEGVYMPENAENACKAAYGETATPVFMPKGSPPNMVNCSVDITIDEKFENGVYTPSRTYTKIRGPIIIEE